jgi:hypothetical protein
MRLVLSLLFFVTVLVAACSGESEAFEECDHPGGGPGVCEPGLVCGRASEKAPGYACIPLCDDDKDCANGSDCKGVEGTNVKGCRFKD